MRGKYSPTVWNSYQKNQEWWKKASTDGLWDRDGYDSYGYNAQGVDRAGHTENDYLTDEDLYDSVWLEWLNVELYGVTA